MTDIDKRIQEALRRDDASGALSGEPNLFEEVITAFRGRHRWLSTLMFVMNFVIFFGAVWAAIRFYNAGDVTEQLRWGGLALLLILMVSFMKVWFWLEMQTNRIMREIKRVELLLVTRRPDDPKR